MQRFVGLFVVGTAFGMLVGFHNAKRPSHTCADVEAVLAARPQLERAVAQFTFVKITRR